MGSSLGIFNMDLKMGKRLNCKYADAPTNYSKTGEEFVTAGGMGPVALSCEYKGNLDDDLLETILQNFTDELAHPSTTSTTTYHPMSNSTTPPPAPQPTTAEPSNLTTAPPAPTRLASI